MRNARFTLNGSEAGRVGAYTRIIRDHIANGHPLTVAFTKDDGTPRVIAGTVEGLKGEGSHSVVTLRMADGSGFRSAHLYAISELKVSE